LKERSTSHTPGHLDAPRVEEFQAARRLRRRSERLADPGDLLDAGAEQAREGVTEFIERVMRVSRKPGPHGTSLRVVRGRSHRLSPVERNAYAETAERDLIYWRPQTRAECADIPRPCPYVGCRYNLWLDETAKGGIRVNMLHEPEEQGPSCVLDEAVERGPMTLEEVGERLNLTRERVRQVERDALLKLERAGVLKELSEAVGDGNGR
jgi:hypothetical protein